MEVLGWQKTCLMDATWEGRELGWVTREEKVEFSSSTETCTNRSGQEEGFRGEMFTRTDHPQSPPAL